MNTDVIKSPGKIVVEEVPIRGFKAAVVAILLSGNLWCSGAGAADAVGWRTDGTGRYPDAKPCVAWSPTSNVIWRTQMPGWGNATPAIAGDRLFVCAEPATLLCVSKADGSILWQRTNSYEQVMTPEESAKAAKDKADADELRKKLGPIEKDLQKAKNDLKKTPEDEEIKKKIGELQPQVEDLKKRLSGVMDMSVLGSSATDQKLTLETMLTAHEDLVKISPDNLPKFKNVMAYLSADLKQFEGG